MTVLTVTQLSVKRRARALFQPVSFQLSNGELLVLTGQNGIGKSTLLKSLMGLIPYHRGEIIFEQHCQPHLPHDATHYWGHQNGWLLNASVWDNLKLQYTLFPHTMQSYDKPTYEQALDQWSLLTKSKAPVYTLSAGQQRALACCALSLNQARLWLLDEPYVHLSLQRQAQLSQLFQSHLARSGSILMVLHDYPQHFPSQHSREYALSPAH